MANVDHLGYTEDYVYTETQFRVAHYPAMPEDESDGVTYAYLVLDTETMVVVDAHSTLTGAREQASLLNLR